MLQLQSNNSFLVNIKCINSCSMHHSLYVCDYHYAIHGMLLFVVRSKVIYWLPRQLNNEFCSYLWHYISIIKKFTKYLLLSDGIVCILDSVTSHLYWTVIFLYCFFLFINTNMCLCIVLLCNFFVFFWGLLTCWLE